MSSLKESKLASEAPGESFQKSMEILRLSRVDEKLQGEEHAAGMNLTRARISVSTLSSTLNNFKENPNHSFQI